MEEEEKEIRVERGDSLVNKVKEWENDILVIEKRN
jgi:hypothetical protein